MVRLFFFAFALFANFRGKSFLFFRLFS